ncbi:putative integral membrane protein [Serinicoccus hydrothermalis]|uniref:Putative integral membrane protein n=2 Tax=Serinicoccus hydrothermalis TaxID=1758689 RepID=A0A1B1NFN7_9MICO|nr:putative integral membrane protein [Serinicoccus hydrothermalis]
MLAGLWAMLPLGVLLVAVTVLPTPERVPTHWSGRLPDASADGARFLSGILATTVVCTVVAALTAIARRIVPATWCRWVLAVVAAIGWGAAVLWVVTAWRVGVDGPGQVREWWPLLALVGALVAAVVGYAVHGRRVPSREELEDLVPERSRVRPVHEVRPVEPWSTEVESRTLKVLAWGLLVALAVVAVVVRLVGESLALSVVVLLTGVGASGLALLWSAIRVEVDESGLRVRSRVVPRVVLRVRAEQVAGVDVQELDPMKWGGIGLRALPDRTAYIVGAGGGPGMVVYQRDGRRLALQITEGDAAARTGARTLLQAAGQRLGEGSLS